MSSMPNFSMLVLRIRYQVTLELHNNRRWEEMGYFPHGVKIYRPAAQHGIFSPFPFPYRRDREVIGRQRGVLKWVVRARSN